MKKQVIHFKNIGELLSLKKLAAKNGIKPSLEDLSVLKRQSVLVEAKTGKIVYIGSSSKKLPSQFQVEKQIDLEARTLMPSFVESHTHLVFAGNRASEFEMRNQGKTYQEIAKAGGGILSTVKATRKEKALDLLRISQERVDDFVKQGVSVLEVKSGYGLDLKTEKKILEVAKKLKGPQIVKCFLGAHSIAPEFREQEKGKDKYFQLIIEKMIPTLQKEKLIDRVDIFVEESYFDLADLEQLAQTCQDLKLDLCVHADQLTRSGASYKAAKLQAKSVDHAVILNEADRKALASANTTAVLLPTADIYIHAPYPNARKLIDEGVRVALATDFNPGTSPTQDLSFVGVLARLQLKMSLAECIAAYTYNAACALGMEKEIGSIEVGKRADFCELDMDWRDLFYSVGKHKVKSTYRAGKRIYRSKE